MPPADPARAERLKAALRANLKRRKDAGREARETDAARPAEPPPGD